MNDNNNLGLRQEPALVLDAYQLLAQCPSPAMRKVLNLIERGTRKGLGKYLITGETGTGKDLVARAIYKQSGCNGGYVAVNCGALPSELAESLLFGHERGSFTGANGQEGFCEQANGGVLHLDELGEMPPHLQIKLLRGLDTWKFRRIGGAKEYDARFILVAATNRNLEQMMREKTMRSDLYYRLGGYNITVPPLRNRPEDVDHLAKLFLKQAAGDSVTLSPEATAALRQYGWPGNVRELQNKIEAANALCDDGLITPDNLGLAAEGTGDDGSSRLSEKIDELIALLGDQPLLKIIKKELILALLRAGYSRNKIAQMLGISRRTLYRKNNLP